MKFDLRSAVLSCVLMVGACSTTASNDAQCEPGERDTCVGDADCTGVRSCLGDGTYSACECGGASGGTGNSGGSGSGATSGSGGSASGGSASGGSASGGSGNASGAAGVGGTGAGGSAGSGGSAGAGGSAGGGGAAGAGGTGGSADTCTWLPLEAPWIQVPVNGSFENWTGTLPTGWTDGDRHGTTGDYEKVPGCAGMNALRLTDTASQATLGSVHGARGFFIPPTVAFPTCWQMRGYGRRESGSVASGSAGITFHVLQGWEHINLAATSTWQPRSATFQVDEEIVATSYLQVTIGADDLNGVTALDFDNIEIWYHDGPCD